MLHKFRFISRLHLLAALFVALVLSLMAATFSPQTVSAATTTSNEPTHQISGKVTAKGADTFTVQFSNSPQQATFRVNADTKYNQPGNTKPTFVDLKIGMQLAAVVKYFGGNSTYYVATNIYLPAATPPPPCYTSGWLSAAVGSKTATSINVVWVNGEKSKVAFAVSPNTVITKNGQPVSFNDVKVGQRIEFKVKSCGTGNDYQILEMHLL